MEISPYSVIREVMKIIENWPKKPRTKRKTIHTTFTDEIIKVKPSETSISPNQPSSSSSPSSRSLRKRKSTIIHDEEDYDINNHENTSSSSSSSRSLRKRKITVIHDEEDYDINNHENTVSKEEEAKKRKVIKSSSSSGGGSKNKGGGKKNKLVRIIEGPNPPPDFPQETKEFIEKEFQCYDLQLILQRTLFRSDADTQQNRFSIPEGKLESQDFLTPREWAEAAERFKVVGNNFKVRTLKNGKKKEPPLKGRRVLMVDTHRNIHVVDFKRWDLNSTSSFMFTHKWSAVVKANHLQEDDLVQIWFFRDKECEPCFALVKLEI